MHATSKLVIALGAIAFILVGMELFPAGPAFLKEQGAVFAPDLHQALLPTDG